ncbi:DNA-binding protein [Rhizobium leguminosarum]|uniref:helix-turn-helix transcriptional regulator n=1 Tax=Rhizobium leguminosarum TaxID=384 RepID=UPI00102FB86D|nr:DNA-binding protein [Rhizobium leguminosarum]TBD04225.1 DNA-binding protein [Rhizobium leguminosarum]
MQAYLTRPQVRARYQISEMTMWRWEQNHDLNFPKPMVVGRRKYFKEEELTAWERDRAKVSA